MIEVLAPGVGSSLQDHGRPGWAWLGVGRSGAADRSSHDLANRLVGNDDGLATIETSGGLRLRLRAAALLAVAGAVIPWTVDGGPPLGNGLAQALPAGATLSAGAPSSGMRAYVAVRGGFDVEPVLGSRSTDTLGKVGPGLPAVLLVGADPGTLVPTELIPPVLADTTAEVDAGPRRDWFTDAAWAALLNVSWQVTGAADRVGVRLSGPPLDRRVPGELASEGVVLGAVQVPPDGQPIVLLADHPVTGGYPVIAVVTPSSLAAVAQAVPGGTLRFHAARG